MSNTKLTMIISGAVALIPVLIYLFLYSKMPESVPIHYDGNRVDRLVSKSSFEVILLSGLGCLGFILMKSQQLLLQKVFILSYKKNPAAVSRVWNVSVLVVTAVFTSISSYALVRIIW